MKLIGSLLVTISLILGTYAASTAYLIRLDKLDPDRDPVTLHAPAGRAAEEPIDPARPREPLLMPGTIDQPLTLTEEHIEILRAADTQRVHVKEFSLWRWSEAWLFGLSCIGLLAGSLMVRTATKRELAAAAATKIRGTQTASPQELLDGALEKARGLQRELEPMSDRSAKLRRIMRQIEVLQDEHFEPFVYNRAIVINQLGMAGYAQLMDKFAAAERQFNRAWSAAADGVLDEAEESLTNGIPLLDEARQRLS